MNQSWHYLVQIGELGAHISRHFDGPTGWWRAHERLEGRVDRRAFLVVNRFRTNLAGETVLND